MIFFCALGAIGLYVSINSFQKNRNNVGIVSLVVSIIELILYLLTALINPGITTTKDYLDEKFVIENREKYNFTNIIIIIW